MTKYHSSRLSVSEEPRALFKKKKRRPFLSSILMLVLFTVCLILLDLAGIFDAPQALQMIMDADSLNPGS